MGITGFAGISRLIPNISLTHPAGFHCGAVDKRKAHDHAYGLEKTASARAARNRRLRCNRYFCHLSQAHAQDTGKSCNSECLLRQIDTLDRKVEALERTVDALTIEANKSIKSGQKIILHTDPGNSGGGCLTYIGPSGDLGGFVSWNVNCAHGTAWVIK
jgi:hypothetical protein